MKIYRVEKHFNGKWLIVRHFFNKKSAEEHKSALEDKTEADYRVTEIENATCTFCK